MSAKFIPLEWEYDDECCWEAVSHYNVTLVKDDGYVPATYRILICDDGEFIITESDKELLRLARHPVFETLKAAKAFCEKQERKDYEAGTTTDMSVLLTDVLLDVRKSSV